jgi:hypothetical protein
MKGGQSLQPELGNALPQLVILLFMLQLSLKHKTKAVRQSISSIVGKLSIFTESKKT